MAVNGEAIFGTRPWKIYGEGPSKVVKAGSFNESKLQYTSSDIRFTQSKDGKNLYAIALGWPADGKLVVKSLASTAGKINVLSMLGHAGTLDWRQTAEGLDSSRCHRGNPAKIFLPSKLPVKISSRWLL